MITRVIEKEVLSSIQKSPVIALLGPRQIGKTTLAHHISLSQTRKCIYLDLEKPSDVNKLIDPELFLTQNMDALVILDEIQRKPEVLPILRSLVDERRRHQDPYSHYVLLGSSSKHLLHYSSETLAGRIRYLNINGFSVLEVENQDSLWVKGGFPESYLLKDATDSFIWRENMIKTYIEREMYVSHYSVDTALMGRFWTMLAHTQSELFNASKMASSLGISSPTVSKYLDILVDLFMVRVLKPWHQNLGKRLVKTPKVYVRDSGMLHALLGLKTMNDVLSHPVAGGSFEGFVIENIMSLYQRDIWFYRTSAGAEMDLFLEKEKIGIEVKRSLSPTPSKGFYQAIKDLELEHAYIVYSGKETYSLSKQVTVISLEGIMRKIASHQI